LKRTGVGVAAASRRAAASGRWEATAVLRRASSGRAEAVARGRAAAEDDRDASEECRAVTEGGTPDVGGGGLSRGIWRHAGPW
jgi:hypothetical protein